MKILLINTVSGYGSTGSICTDIASVVENQGHECYIAYGQGKTTYSKSYKIGTVIENNLHNLGSRITGKQGYFTKRGTNRFVEFIKDYNPDVIHLHNLHGNYLNLKILFEYLIEVQRPVVWTLHDCWAFTGKCAHYTDIACYKWQTQCKQCPQVQKYPPSLFFDKSKRMFEDKQRWFTSLKNLTIISVSHWLESELKKSFFKEQNIVQIYNWVDYKTFKFSNKSIKSQYGIGKGKFIILGVSAGWHAVDTKLKDFIALNKLISKDMQIVLVGKTNQKDIPSSIIHIPYVQGKEELAKIYNSADAYVHVSTEDTFGKVIAEAMSCGTPVITYNSTACPEIVGDGCGYSVEKRNIRMINEKLQLIQKKGKSYYTKYCREHVLSNFDITININTTINIYKEIIKNDC